MRKNFLFGLVVSIVWLLSIQSAFAQTLTFSGRVVESSNNSIGVSAVALYTSPAENCGTWDEGIKAYTNAFGYYSFEVPEDCEFLVFPVKKNRSFLPASRVISPILGPYDDVDWFAQ